MPEVGLVQVCGVLRPWQDLVEVVVVFDGTLQVTPAAWLRWG